MKKYIVTLIIFLILFLFLVMFLLINVSKAPTPVSKTGPSPAEKQNSGSASNNYVVNNNTRLLLQHDYYVSKLIGFVPYRGKNFYLYYDFKQGNFILTINQDNQSAGNEEFDVFLNKNQIQNRSWITNLIITTGSITPAP